MKNVPNSKSNLDRALQRFAGDFARAHDLIDLQLIMAGGGIDIGKTAELCRSLFRYRKVHDWPPKVEKGEGWAAIYNDQKGELPVLATVDEAIAWANNLIAKLVIA